MRAIPAIDLMDGRPVRLCEGDYSRRTSYGMTALEAAKRFEDGGLSCLHLVDLDAAGGKGRDNLRVLEEIAAATHLHIDFGGGIRTEEACRRAFSAGAERVNAGSAAVRDAEAVLSWERLWPGRIRLSADAREGRIAVSGWQEHTDILLPDFIGYFVSRGIRTGTPLCCSDARTRPAACRCARTAVPATSGSRTSRLTHRAVQKLFQPLVSIKTPPLRIEYAPPGQTVCTKEAIAHDRQDHPRAAPAQARRPPARTGGLLAGTGAPVRLLRHRRL